MRPAFLVVVGWLFMAPQMAVAQAGKAPAAGGQNNGGQSNATLNLNVGGTGGPGNKRVPRDDYYAAFVPYNTGDFVVALRSFQDASKGGIRSIDGRWVDSICFHTMIGECYYQMGDYVQALDQHTSALKLAMAHSDWLGRVQWPADISPIQATMRFPITWGVSSRRVVFGRYPDTISSFQGRLDNQNVLANGGVFQQPQLYPVNVLEIVRCTALSLRRRLDLLGPVAAVDPLSAQLADLFARQNTAPNHWSQAFLNVQAGLALAAAGKSQAAVSELQKGLLAAGQFEHPLTSTALLELGKLAFAAGQYEAAATFYAEATFSAAVYSQNEPYHYDVMEEAFRGGLVTHLVTGQKKPYPPLLLAAAWAQRNCLPLQASLLTLAGENLLSISDTATAMARLSDARRVIGRRDCATGAIGARLQFETAKLQFQMGNLAPGNTALTLANSFLQRGGSRRMLQINIADGYFSQGLLSERVAEQLFAELLREPQPVDWTVEPAETLAVEMTPHLAPLEHWFELAMKREIARDRREPDKALEIADRIRRHRFFSTQPLGGRLLALRWLLEAPEELLPERGVLQRQDLLVRYPRYAELARQSAALRQEIARLPLVVVDDEEAAKQQTARCERLIKLIAAQEVALHDMALNRNPADISFPPLLDVKQLQQRLDPKQLLLAFYNGSRGTVGFALTREKYASWPIESPAKLRGDIAELLKRMGNVDRNRPLDAKDLRDAAGWKSLAKRILPIVTNNTPVDAWSQFDELILVPDGPLWYLPFEALPIGGDDDATPLLARVRIRYAPTVSLAVPDNRPRKPEMTTAAIAGKLFPKDGIEVAAEGVEQLGKSLPGVVRLLPKPLVAPTGVLTKFYDRLVVYHDMDDLDRVATPFEWSPAQMDKGKPGSSLAQWQLLPWGGPQQVAFPGFHTAAETAMKKNGGGDEIFLAVCGLMSSGTRTILLSRWRAAGQVSYDLLREYQQELPHESASAAWKRSVELRKRVEIDPTLEPRLRLAPNDELPKPEHPFFWAGYLLVDTGASPLGEKPQFPAPPVPKATN